MTETETNTSDLQLQIEELKRKIEIVTAERDLLKDLLLQRLGGGQTPRSPAEEKIVHALRTMTPRMHATLQMATNGWTNAQIADRLGVKESTAKVYMRGVMKKLNAENRHEATSLVRKILDGMPEADYLAMARIPKNWAEAYQPGESDPFSHLFEKTR
jgi:DNA-binding CsgD family transcriptional regulator